MVLLPDILMIKDRNHGELLNLVNYLFYLFIYASHKPAIPISQSNQVFVMK